MDVDRVNAVIRDLRASASRAKTIYGGSDFDPVDYQVVEVSPGFLNRMADHLEEAVKDKRGNLNAHSRSKT